jgi:transposase
MRRVPRVSELEKAQAKIRQLEDKLLILTQQIDWLKRQLFGRKSEAGRDPNQGELSLELAGEKNKEEKEAAVVEKRVGSAKVRRLTRALRLPENLPVREEVIVPPRVKAEPEPWRRMTEEVSEQLEKEPEYFYLRRTIRPKFVKKEAAHEPPVVAPAPPTLIAGGF